MPETREPHPVPAATDQYGQRQHSPQPADADIVRNFGRPYGDPQPQTTAGES